MNASIQLSQLARALKDWDLIDRSGMQEWLTGMMSFQFIRLIRSKFGPPTFGINSGARA